MSYTPSAFLKDSDQTLADGTDIAVGSTTGTKIGTANTQKLGIYGATPIVQPAGTADLRLSLINLGLIGTGTLPLNLSGGALNAGTAAFAGAVGGSGTAFSWKRFSLTFPSDADYTLAAGELDAVVIDVATGVITATRNIIVPATGSAFYWVLNRNAQAVVLKTATGTGITVAATRMRPIYFPTGTNAFAAGPAQDYTV